MNLYLSAITVLFFSLCLPSKTKISKKMWQLHFALALILTLGVSGGK
jgi:hypothetical protein